MSITLPVPVSANDWQEGPAEAPVTLVVYGDFQCEDTRAAYPALKRLLAESAGKLRLVYRHLPLTDIHLYALDAAKAAEAAGTLGTFWPMCDALFAGDPNDPKLTKEDLQSYARRIGLQETDFAEAFAAPRAYTAVREDVDGIRTTGIGSTPALFLNGLYYHGLLTFDALSAAIAETAC